MENFKHWLLYSSKDKTKIALTVKAGLTTLVLLGVPFGYSISGGDLDSLVGSTTDAIYSLITLCSAVATVYGFFRKFKNKKVE